ncbi:MAG: EAL domain-containing protein [Gemmatimonadaceae bacterium]|nr:EAL domain-containing protein [Gemmatimonadaceae bacterium]NUO95259.1 EAL domain-containing protein [Gemmatimonadaceae bacterium]NUP57468.1 EAL domain-containing protein [Gemmatimonadaceae bacterium]NUP69989.1 EAL domain-containing protein [Gemmatimonadaceae bacterium]NUR34523.1 EAL domain-containing protein [Gemmatimonadaceae bacterium]
MSESVLLTDTDDVTVRQAVAQLDGWRADCRTPEELGTALAEPGVRALLLTTSDPSALRAGIEQAHLRGVPVLVGCADEAARRRAVELKAEEWFLLPASADEIAARTWSAVARGTMLSMETARRVDQVEQEQMLHDSLTGLPTLPVAIERSRQYFKERGELVVLYFNFVRYSKIEEIYGWEKLDAVLETTASAVREFLDDDDLGDSRVMVSFTNDDDFIFFHVPQSGVKAASEGEITEMVTRLQRHVGAQIEAAHGEDIAALFDIYVGRAHLYYNPKIRLERLIYRGIREAQNASRSVEQRERARRVSDLKTSLRDRLVYVDYHPIVVATTKEIFGYEALARGRMRTLRSPEVMFDVAAEADMIWELSRLCRARAIEGMNTILKGNELLFINVDPHDFTDPAFTEQEVADPSRVVIEITERTAIKDYPKFRDRLKAFREIGYRFAVDDAGSGYAGLGSIANLEPDFIKLDISLISAIDTNFIKQNLVQTMVRFANEHGAKVIAEGVERAEEFKTVQELGVHLVQGFYLHRPQSAGASVIPHVASA